MWHPDLLDKEALLSETDIRVSNEIGSEFPDTRICAFFNNIRAIIAIVCIGIEVPSSQRVCHSLRQLVTVHSGHIVRPQVAIGSRRTVSNGLAGCPTALGSRSRVTHKQQLHHLATANRICRMEAAPKSQPSLIIPISSHEEGVDSVRVIGELSGQNCVQVADEKLVAVVLSLEAGVKVDAACEVDLGGDVGSSPVRVHLVIVAHHGIPGRVADMGSHVVHEGDCLLLFGSTKVAQEDGVDVQRSG